MTETAAEPEPHRTCPSCARPVADDARFCLHCGRGLPVHPTAPSGGQQLTSAGTGERSSAVATGEAGTTTSDVEAADTDQVTCANCNAANLPERALCLRCGVDLEDPDPGLIAVGGSQDPSMHLERSGGIGTAWMLPLAAIVVTVGVLVAMLAALQLGPFSPSTELPEATFDATSYPGDAAPLAVTDVATLTARADDDGRSFAPVNLVDNNPTTSWHGEADELPEATDEPIDLFLAEPAWVSALVVTNGDQRSPDDYEAAGRVQRAELVFDGDVRIPVTLLDQGLAEQIVELDEPLLTTSVRLEIRETFPGQERDDPALSDLVVWGHVADEDDARIAEERVELAPAAGSVLISD